MTEPELSGFSMQSTASPPLVELRNVTFGYGERAILRDVSLTIPRGKVTALMGASGGGKTTILRLIGGQVRAQAAEVSLVTVIMRPPSCWPCALGACLRAGR